MRRIRIGVALMFCLACKTAFAQSGILEFGSGDICNASGAIAIDENRIMVGDDEEAFLPIFALAGPKFLDSTKSGVGEADIEGGTILQGRVIWITSHGRNKDGEVKPKRQKIFASHRIDNDGKLAASSPAIFTGLLNAIATKAGKADSDPAYRQMSESFGPASTDAAFAPKVKGFNIEGLATTEGLESPPAVPGLLVGLRNPLTKDGEAILFEIRNAIALVDDPSASADLGRVFKLDLKGRRIRDIAYSRAAGAYLIIGGLVGDNSDKPKDGGSAFAVFKWTGRPADQPVKIDAFGNLDALDRFHPEVILPLLTRVDGKLAPSNRVLLVSDDGKRKIGGKDCEDLPKAQRKFRGLIKPVD